MSANSYQSAAELESAAPDDFPPGAIEGLLRLVAETGRRVCEHYNNADPVSVSRKDDSSPVTAADHDAHDCLFQGLSQLTPMIPVLSEESPPESIAQRHQWTRCWMVDPLDGTREFISRTGEFTINVALIEAGRPILGVIAVPLTARAYLGIPGSGLWRCEGDELVQCVRLQPPQRAASQSIRVLASVRHHPERVQAVLDRLAVSGRDIERLNAGSALKFCALVEGEGEVYPRTSPCCEWDVAAGDALVQSVGGWLKGPDGAPLQYNCRDSLLVHDFTAAVDHSADWLALLGHG